MSDRLFLVTGGTRGIGAAITRHILSRGDSVIANYVRNQAAADALAHSLNSPEKLQVCKADVARDSGINGILATIGDRKLDGFVHCAVTGIHKPISELTMRHWDWTFSVNLRSFFALTIHLRSRLRSGSSILGVSSEGAVRAAPNYSLVASTKGGLEALCRSLALDLRDDGIRVNVLSAGSVVTEAWKAFPNKSERLDKMRRLFPNGSSVSLDEIAEIACFLLSDRSSGINAQTIVVDRGERVFDL